MVITFSKEELAKDQLAPQVHIDLHVMVVMVHTIVRIDVERG